MRCQRGLARPSCGGFHAECQPSLYLPVFIIPKVCSDLVQVCACSEPVITPIEGSPCSYMLYQHVCISVPITYGAEVLPGTPSICCNPCSSCNIDMEVY